MLHLTSCLVLLWPSFVANVWSDCDYKMFRFNTNKLQVPGKLQIGKRFFLLVNFLDRKIPRSLMLSLAFFLFSTGGFLNWFWIVIVSNSPLPRRPKSLLHPLKSKLPLSFANFKIKLQILWRFAENYRGLGTSSCVSQRSQVISGHQWVRTKMQLFDALICCYKVNS